MYLAIELRENIIKILSFCSFTQQKKFIDRPSANQEIKMVDNGLYAR